MASKRKRGQEEETAPVTTSTRATRSSTRQTKSTTAATTKKTTKKKAEEDPVDGDSTIVAPQPKKSRATKTTKRTAKSTKSKQNDVSDNVDKDLNGAVASLFLAFALMLFTSLFCCRSNSHHPDDPAEPSSSTQKQDTEPPAPVRQRVSSSGKPSLTSSVKKTEPYNPADVQSLFKAYAGEDNAEYISAENFERLCTDANVPMEGPMPLILLWHMDAQDLGTIKRDQWTRAMQDSQISSLVALRIFLGEMEELLLTTKPPIPQPPTAPTKKPPPYDRTQYYSYARDRGAAFGKLYSALFTIAKTGQSRNIDIEIAKAFWSVLLVPLYPIMTEVVEYITEKGTYKAVNKDVWSMMLEFCKSIGPNLDSYEADGAWPTLIDDFVAWKKERLGDRPAAPTTDEA